MTTPPGPHDDIHYLVRRYGAQNAERIVVDQVDQSIEVYSVCPGCAGQTARRYDWDRPNVYKGSVFRRGGDMEEPPATATMSCECGFSHENRPDTASFRGCGGSWTVSLDTSA